MTTNTNSKNRKIMKKEINLIENPNAIKEFIDSKEAEKTSHLTISGEITEEDYGALIDFYNNFRFIKSPLEYLNMRDAFFVSKGEIRKETFSLAFIHSLNNLKEFVFHKNLKTIPKAIFHFSHNLSKITLPENLERIESFGLECPKVTKIKLPETLKVIEDSAFDSMGIKKIFIPDSVETIIGQPFSECKNLEEIIVSPENKRFSVIDGVLFSKDKKKLLAVPPALKQKNYKVPVGTKIIAEGSFYSFLGESVILPDTVKTIEPRVFYYCYNLERIEIPDSVTHIGVFMCHMCGKLKYVRLSESITKIDEVLFINCTMDTLKLPDNIKYVRPNSFSHVIGLKEIQLTDQNPNYKVVDGSLYSKDMKRIICAPDGKINNRFRICEGVEVLSGIYMQTHITKAVLPDSIKKIERNTFYGCRDLISVSFGKNIETIYYDAFMDCDKLSEFRITAPKPPKIVKTKRGITDQPFWCDLDFKKLTVYVPKSSVETYKNAKYWKESTIKEL